MQALFYAVPEDGNGSEIRRNIEETMPEAHIERHTTVGGLKDRLLRGLDKKTVAVISITSEEDLIDTYFIQHLLSKVFLIVLLPDRERHTVAMGHRLHPYFVCCADDGTPRLAEVLRSIVHDERPPEPTASFRNPFEAVMPINCTGDQSDARICAAA
ncbi:MAG: hypothetical protein A4E63_00880 [Syntrophorhabdus sp. PtaU1.Bin050]|nr:MAG: hypothetical protein A4E63_00880 [Syntrophorhabdus sp. PtaU1.Bin050]